MKALDDITTLTEVRAYAAAEAADASKQCPAAYNDYKNAVDMVAGYMTFAGTALEITYVEMIRQMIKNARNTWYAVGCAAPASAITEQASVQTAEPVPDNAGAAMAIGGGASNYILIIAALGAAIWYFGSKKKGTTKSKAKAKRTTRRRVARRRRR